MKIGMTLPVMEPDLTRKDLEKWTKKIDAGPWSHIALGERILFPNPEFISTLSAVSAWTCLLYTSPSPRDGLLSRMPSSA